MTPRKTQSAGTLRITQVRSRIGNQERIVRVLTDGLGLGRIGSSVELPDNPYTRGMVAKVAHIVRVEETGAAEAPAATKRAAAKTRSAKVEPKAEPEAEETPAAKPRTVKAEPKAKPAAEPEAETPAAKTRGAKAAPKAEPAAEPEAETPAAKSEE